MIMSVCDLGILQDNYTQAGLVLGFTACKVPDGGKFSASSRVLGGGKGAW